MGDIHDLYLLCSLEQDEVEIANLDKFNIINKKNRLNEVLEMIEKKKFEESYLIVDEKKITDLFNELEKKAKKDLYMFLKIFIICSEENHYNSLINYNPYYNSPFFTKDFVFKTIKDLKIFLKGRKKNENAVIFDEYNDEKDLQLLDFYNLLSEPSTEEIQKFQNELYDKYRSNDIEIEKLLKQSDGIELKNIKGIIAKYWLKIYEMSENFSNEMNLKLQKNRGSCYDVYIRLLYFALKNEYITPFIPSRGQTLYKRIKIDEAKLQKFTQSKKFICYIRSFMIFNTNNKEEKDTNLWLEIENPDYIINKETSTSVSLKEFKENQNENEEILFFPFSSFKAVDKIEKEGNHYKLKLTYLGKYSNKNDKYESTDSLEKFKNDLVRGNITSEQKIRENYPDLLKKKSEIKAEFKVKNYQDVILINPEQDDTRDCVKIQFESSKNGNNSDEKLSTIHKFTKAKKYNIIFSFSDGLEDFTYLFKSSEVVSLDLSNFNMENLNSFQNMFCDCKQLTKIKFSNVELKNIDDLSGMFFNCLCLKSINLENFIKNNKKIKKMDYTFYKCKSLKKINFQNLETECDCSFNNTFYEVNKKCKVEVKDNEIKKQWNDYLTKKKNKK